MVKFKQSSGEEIKPVKGMSIPELIALKQKLGHVTTDTERRRPRNPNEWKYLKKWEYERGTKIGNIGPPPKGLEDFDPATWNPERDEEMEKEAKTFDKALKEGMGQYDDALNRLKDR